MAADNPRLRNGVLLAVAMACLAYAAYAIVGAWRRPRSTDRDEVLLVCTKCAAESRVSSEEFGALLMDEDTLAVKCPRCGELAAYSVALRCPHCGRAIPARPGLEGTAYVCPYCKKPLGSAPAPPG